MSVKYFQEHICICLNFFLWTGDFIVGRVLDTKFWFFLHRFVVVFPRWRQRVKNSIVLIFINKILLLPCERRVRHIILPIVYGLARAHARANKCSTCVVYTHFFSRFPAPVSRNPLANGLLSIFNWVICEKTKRHSVSSCSLHPRGETKRTKTWGTHDGYAPFRFGRPSRRWTRFLWTRTCGKSSTAVWWCRWLGLDGNGAGTCASSSIWSRVAKKKSEKDGEWEEREKQKK